MDKSTDNINDAFCNVNLLVNNLANEISCGTLTTETLQREIEVAMTRKKIETKYGQKIQQMPNGLWWIRLENGKVIKRTERENVIKKLMSLEQDDAPTIDKIWNDFFQHRRLTTADGTSGKNLLHYETFIKGQPIAQMPLKKITFNDCEKWAKNVLAIKATMPNKNVTKKYFYNVRGTLSQIFEYAILQKYMKENYALLVDIHQDNLTPKKVHRDEDDIFLHDEEEAVTTIAYDEAVRKSNSIPLAIPFLFNTGIRDGELCALHWRDIDLDAVKMHIQGEIVEDRDELGKANGYKYVGHTKTNAGNRYVPLNSEALSLLTMIKKYNLMNGFGINQDDFIFQRNHHGKITFCTTRCFEPRLKRYCREADMKVLKSQHDIRRTFATNLYDAGMNIKIISAIMGHESISQTEAYIKANLSDAKETNMLMERLTKINRNKSEQKVV